MARKITKVTNLYFFVFASSAYLPTYLLDMAPLYYNNGTYVGILCTIRHCTYVLICSSVSCCLHAKNIVGLRLHYPSSNSVCIEATFRVISASILHH